MEEKAQWSDQQLKCSLDISNAKAFVWKNLDLAGLICQWGENNSFEYMYIPNENQHHLKDSLGREQNIQHKPPSTVGSNSWYQDPLEKE